MKRNIDFKNKLYGALDKSKLWLKKENFKNVEFDQNNLIKRVLQHIFYSSKVFFCLESIAYDKHKNKKLFSAIEKEIILENITINTKNGIIKVKLKHLIKMYVIFLLKMTYCFFDILLGILKKKQKIKQYNILWDSLNRQNENKFLNILKLTKNSSFKKILNQKPLLIKSEFNYKYKNINYLKNPLSYLVKNNLNSEEKFKLLKNLITSLFLYSKLFISKNYLILIYEDFINNVLLEHLDKKKLIYKNIFTTSNLSDQKSWLLRKKKFFKSVLIWNSSAHLISFKSNNFTQKNNYKGIEYLNNDLNLVWENKFKKSFNQTKTKTGLTQFKMMYLPKNKNEFFIKNLTKSFLINKKDKNICIFDINPNKEIQFNNIKLKFNDNFSNIKKFVNDIVNITKKISNNKNKRINIYYKVKGTNNKLIKKKYDKFLTDINKNYSNFYVLDKSTNVFDLLKYTDLSITFPISSIPYVEFPYLNRVGLFYDSTNFYKKIYYKGCKLISDTKHLEKEIKTRLLN